MKTVLVFGTFDILHPGHRWFLRNAAEKGDRIVAVVSRDDFVLSWKGSPPLKSQESRIEALKLSGLVDDAVLADPEIRTYGVVQDIQPDLICLGHDQRALLDDLNLRLAGISSKIPEIVLLPPWKRKRYSSTVLNRTLRGAGPTGKTGSWILTPLMILAMATFGFSWVSGKRISSAASPATLACIRFAVTFICFLPTLVGRPLPKIVEDKKKSGWIWLISAAILITAYNLLFFVGLGTGLAGKGGLIVTTLNPLFTFLIILFTGTMKPKKTAVAGILLGIAGGVILMEPWRHSLAQLADSGNLAFLAAALAWSLLTLAGRKAQKIYGFRRFNLGLYLIAALMTLPFAVHETGGRPPVFPGASFWGDMLFISAAVGAFGTGTYFVASLKLGAAKGSAYTYLVPVFALTFTAILLGERPDLLMILGGCLAIAAVLLINSSGRPDNS